MRRTRFEINTANNLPGRIYGTIQYVVKKDITAGQSLFIWNYDIRHITSNRTHVHRKVTRWATAVCLDYWTEKSTGRELGHRLQSTYTALQCAQASNKTELPSTICRWVKGLAAVAVNYMKPLCDIHGVHITLGSGSPNCKVRHCNAHRWVNPLNPELNPIFYLLALLAHNFLHVSRIMVKSLTPRLLMSYIYIYIYGAHILDVSRSHTTTQHSR